jgi:hypothetical protein
MKKWLNILYNRYKNIKNKTTPGTSSVELIFFVLTCSVLFLFSFELYKFVNDFQKKYSTIIKKKQKSMEEQLKQLDEELHKEQQE